MKPNHIERGYHRDLLLTKESYLYMRMLANRCGIDLNNYKRQAIYNRLLKRIKALNLPDFDTYCNILRMDLEEEVKFINLVTNSTTYFFREEHHFEQLRHYLTDRIKVTNKIRIWSAGCSTGEEAYSIAMVVKECIPDLERYDIKILATDVNSDALTKAEDGIYLRSALDHISAQRQYLWIEQLDNGNIKVKPELQDLISFQQLNFLDHWPMHGPFDVIFCRNVLIYFKKEIALSILEKFDNLLIVGGMLYLGYSENIKDLTNYNFLGKSIYQKKS